MRGTEVFMTAPRILMGPGSINGIGREVHRLDGHRVMMVTDRGVAGAGLLEPVRAALEEAGIEYGVFDRVEPEPRIRVVDDCLEEAGRLRPDILIGIGGGSSIDIAKSAAIMSTNEGKVGDYFGIDLVGRPGLPTIMVPTTAGTGSEVTPVAILSDEDEGLKKGVVSPHLVPRVALLDPELTLGLPPHITASTGMDALCHAIESFTSVNATSLTDLLASRAMEVIYGSIRAAYAGGRDLEARSRMLEGSLLAGMAFGNAGTTAVHAFSYPIGAEFHIPHGLANAIMLPHVMRFNISGNPEKFARVANALGLPTDGMDDLEASETAVRAMEKLAGELGVARRLSEFGVEEKDIARLSAALMKVTRNLSNNPRTVTLEDAEGLYRKAL